MELTEKQNKKYFEELKRVSKNQIIWGGNYFLDNLNNTRCFLIEQISGAIITSFVNLHFLEETKASGLFRHRTKNNVKKTIDDLIEI